MVDSVDIHCTIKPYKQPTTFWRMIYMKMQDVPQDVIVDGNFQTSDFVFGNPAFIVDMFADKVYSHKERAVIRELACNAHDSHVMAGTTDIPFDVHLPTLLEPFFSIRDYGTGLDDNDVRNIFAGIGISTKRDSNEVIGCFGIGSLPPYSMADSFTVRSYKDGICRTYSCYRDGVRNPVVALLTESETNKANGLEVSLSVKGRIHQFEAEAENVFRFWQGTVPNINNPNVLAACKQHRDLYIFQSDDFGLTGGYGDMYAVMGNISYRVPYELCDIHVGGYLKFELGELDFDTARENLSMTDRVRAAVKAKFELVRAQLHDLVTQKIEAEPTPFKRAIMAERLNSGAIGRYANIRIGNYTLPSTSEAIEVWVPGYRTAEKLETKSLPLGKKIEYYEYKPRMTQRVRNYVRDAKRKVVLLTPQQVSECQIDTDLLLNLDNLPKPERKARHLSSRQTVKTFVFTGQGSCYKSDSKNWSEVEVDTGDDEVVYVEINRWTMDGTCFDVRTLKEALGAMRLFGFDVPVIYGLKTAYIGTRAFNSANWIHLDEYIRRELSSRTINVCNFSASDFKRISEIFECVTTEDLDKLDEYASMPSTWDMENLCRRLGVSVEEDCSIQDWMNDFFERFPLVKHIDFHRIKESRQALASYIGGTVK
jgi:hypothetical protein